MNRNIKRIDPKEFQEFGYLQEVNRQFFHPLGLALEVIIDEDGKVSFGGIWDLRDDPLGILFAQSQLSQEKANRVRDVLKAKGEAREKQFGSVIQPVTED
jgi:hypothetical protein